MKTEIYPSDMHICPTCDEPKRVDMPCIECDMPEPEPLCTDCGFHIISNSEHGLCDFCLEQSRRDFRDELAHRNSLDLQFI